ncbi:MAG: LysM peptidoglycan-binding domain-containing protein [Acidimicrobiales bacterium]|nr:LysM peptidoglycan-binding domain-containing protein [Acidimicrobiales bacterium]
MAALLTPHHTPDLDSKSPTRARPTLRLVPDADGPVVASPTLRSTAAPRLPGRVYRRRRATVVLALAALVLGVLAVPLVLDGGVAQGGTITGVPVAVPQVYIVQPGDTLWAIATELAPDRDPRAVVAELSDVAGSAALQVGQRLLIPGNLAG